MFEEGEMRPEDNPLKLVNAVFPNLFSFTKHLQLIKNFGCTSWWQKSYKDQIIFINLVCRGTPVAYSWELSLG